MTIQRVRRAAARAELIELLRTREPETTWPLGLLQRPHARRRSKAWVVRRGGAVGGVFVAVRYCFDRWHAVLLLDDPACASELAQVLDRSNVRAASGPAGAMEAVLALSRRRYRSRPMWQYAIPYVPVEQPTAGPASPPRATDEHVTLRAAVPRDIPGLVALYAAENAFAVPLRRIRDAVRHDLPHTLVAEGPQGLIAAVMSLSGNDYTALRRLVVEPSSRGVRVSPTLVAHAASLAMSEGKGFCAFRGASSGFGDGTDRRPSNGLRAVSACMRPSRGDLRRVVSTSDWLHADLNPRKSFRGQNRLRRLLERLEDRLASPTRPPARGRG